VTNTYKRHRFPPDIISYAVWLYCRFNLSHRDIEDLLVYLVTHIVTFRAPQKARGKAQFAGNVDYLSKDCNAVLGLLGGLWRLAESYNMSDEVH